MNDPPQQSPLSLEANRTRLQQLYARGLIDLFEYEVLGRHHGFVRKLPPPVSHRIRSAAGWVGIVMIVVASVAEGLAQYRPELRGPLETLIQVIDIIEQGGAVTLLTLIVCRMLYAGLTVALYVDRGIDRASAATKRVTRKWKHGKA